MIYMKQASFPYPILNNQSDDYENAIFNLQLDLSDDSNFYKLTIKSEISSEFLKNLIRSSKAELILVIKSKDNKFYKIDSIEKTELKIEKSKISFGKKTVMQLMIKSSTKISFTENNEINEFYRNYKDKINIDEGHALGFSSIILFEGSDKNSENLFEHKVDESIISDLEIQLTDQTILLLYKSEKIKFTGLQKSRDLLNPYIYMGLQKALINFLVNNSENKHDIEEGLNLNDLDEIELSGTLDGKLFTLMKSKGIEKLSHDSIDEVIYLISDNMLGRYVSRISEVFDNEN